MHDKQIGLIARSSDFVVTLIITDRIGLHSVLLPLLMAVLTLIMCVIHQFMLHFEIAGGIVYQSNTPEKT